MADALKDIAEALAADMQCNCDLDNWEPERGTGHSWVCRIHKAAVAAHYKQQGIHYDPPRSDG